MFLEVSHSKYYCNNCKTVTNLILTPDEQPFADVDDERGDYICPNCFLKEYVCAEYYFDTKVFEDDEELTFNLRTLTYNDLFKGSCIHCSQLTNYSWFMDNDNKIINFCEKKECKKKLITFNKLTFCSFLIHNNLKLSCNKCKDKLECLVIKT